jgi:hypothetical protein
MYNHGIYANVRLSASPLRLLANDYSLLKSWPATMIIHGELDGIVPIEHSFYFLSTLAMDGNLTLNKEDKVISKNSNIFDDDIDRIGLSEVNERPRESCVENVEEDKTRDNFDQKNLISNIEQNKNNVNGLINEIGNDHNVNDIMTNKWKIRPQDLMINIRGVKHSFEAIGGANLTIVTDAIIQWLSKLPTTKATE